MRLTHDKKSAFTLAVVSATCVVLSASPVKCQQTFFDRHLIGNETSNSATRDQELLTTTSLTHWSVLVKIKPRPASNGDATIMLIDGIGTTIGTFEGVVLPYSGLARGVRGPRRDIQNGDTPFGVYKFVSTAGGTPEDQLHPGFGTGKVYLDDKDMYGEVADAKRSLIRLHGGGSALPDPYALNQPLLATRGCVRMKNRDINNLIQQVKRLTPRHAVQFIFMGDEAYLNALATDLALSDKPWWRVLRVALHIPSSPSNLAVDTSSSILVEGRGQVSISNAAQQSDAPQRSSESLVELVNVYAEDVGPKGQQALNALRPQTGQLVTLQDTLPADDPLRPKIAFVLCNLDHDCDVNMRVLQSALTDSSRYTGLFADQVHDMISRLIDREDSRGNERATTSLTRTLITVAPQADGALSEGIGMTLSKQLRTRAGVFLSAWGEHFSTMSPQESIGLKSQVFGLMRASHRLTEEEIKRIRNYLYSVRDYSEEFGDAVKDFSQLYFHPTASRSTPTRGRRR